MGTFFDPIRLKEAQLQIQSEHPDESNRILKMIDDQGLRKLIGKLVSMEPRKLKKEAFTLSDNQIGAIAGYIPSNAFSVKRDNLHQILVYRSDKRFWDIYLNAWQDYYLETECNQFLRKTISCDDTIQEAFQERHLETAEFMNILKEDSIPQGLGRYMYSDMFPVKGKLSDRLAYLCIHENTRLYNDCVALFYTYCGHDDYIIADKDSIYLAAKKYSNKELTAFLKNFLGLLTLAELDAFGFLGVYFQKEIGDQRNPKFQKISGLSENLKQKYLDWINRLWIDKYFGKDERSVFWREYRFKSIRRNAFSNSLTLEFDHYYVVEFLGERNGPLYIYDKEYFDTYIRRWTQIESNMDLRQTLLNRARTFRQGHTKNWQRKVQEFLWSRKIAEKIV